MSANTLEKITVSMENYLEAIYELSASSSSGGARITDIACRMGVSKASANNAIALLGERGLITSERYKEVFLTESGLRLAELVSKKHSVIKEFFVTVLGVEGNTADADACAIEHVISSAAVSKMDEYLQKESKKRE